ncbi:MAG: hypothetical protein UT32_C0001G0100 [Parcubacteria group bacterium GW2011_GWC2_39_14]|nr:MAG: hypothetical protein UT32_C0001G0100 [Parcubacteria group bacterium GW2011_GWC2_39_14]KKR55524.1 MAG: hypothetical protein UT91_C0001G0099 [Parcubacteria group bacterium GW2011_GWA2_40_23]
MIDKGGLISTNGVIEEGDFLIQLLGIAPELGQRRIDVEPGPGLVVPLVAFGEAQLVDRHALGAQFFLHHGNGRESFEVSAQRRKGRHQRRHFLCGDEVVVLQMREIGVKRVYERGVELRNILISLGFEQRIFLRQRAEGIDHVAFSLSGVQVTLPGDELSIITFSIAFVKLRIVECTAT